MKEYKEIANKMVTVKAKTLFQLIKEGAKQKSKKVVIEFFPAYDSRIHSYLPERLKKELKKSKIETFDIIEEGQDIIALTKSKDVKYIKWLPLLP